MTSVCFLNCTGCLNPIADMYYLNVGNQFYWHLQCLKCSKCYESLQFDSKCYLLNDGKIMCSEDYFKFKQLEKNKTQFVDNSNKINYHEFCSSCKLKILPNDYIIRLNTNSNKIYHLNCFKCIKCKSIINSGIQFGILNDAIYCSNDYFKFIEDKDHKEIFLGDDQVSSKTSLNDTFTNHHHFSSKQNDFDHNNNDNQCNLNVIESNGTSSSTSCSPSTSSSSTNSTCSSNRIQSIPSKSNMNNKQSSKKKRVRTSFKHQQLRIMKAHFQINQNPDSKDLKELSERTGLQKRVLQVWFQNSRAKQRKNVMMPAGHSHLNTSILLSGPCGISSGSSTSSIINHKMNSSNNNNESFNHDDEMDEESLDYELDEDDENDEIENQENTNIDDDNKSRYQSQVNNLDQKTPQQHLVDFYF